MTRKDYVNILNYRGTAHYLCFNFSRFRSIYLWVHWRSRNCSEDL